MTEPIKCLVWDLDNTVWEGTLLEDAAVRLRPEVVDVIGELDRRGILHSVASRGDEGLALAKLDELGLAPYFLHPRIGWGGKADAIAGIAGALDLGLDAIGFIDDEPYERAEVAHALPAVRCFDAREVAGLPALSALTPAAITPEAAIRRHLYRAEERRQRAERTFAGDRDQFLRELGMRFAVGAAAPADLARAEELTVRTHQLNTTGRHYSAEELRTLMARGEHLLLLARLTDRFGEYGVIGLALVERVPGRPWLLKLLLMSCRVVSRGVGSVLLNCLLRAAHRDGAGLEAEWVPNERNRLMEVTLRFAGFREVGGEDGVRRLRADPSRVPALPAHVTVQGDVP
ncbi:MAG TPA: HAD-IIIC family phosphatase [Candidatus Dormibacteraeota bacterium]|nr:HAD-IIIC family phosphatase [Candidatus Dormibacteraeota bacterium]